MQDNMKPLLPLRDIIVFPSTVVPLFVGREKSIVALEKAMAADKKIILAAQKKPQINDPEPEDIFEIGTLSLIRQLLKLPDGTVKVLVEGQERVVIEEYLEEELDQLLLVKYKPFPAFTVNNENVEATMRAVKEAFDNYVRLNKRIPPEVLLSISTIADPFKLSDTLVAHLTQIKLEERQKLLEEKDPAKRLEMIYAFIQSEIEIMRVEKKIRARVKRQMEKSQKEYYLNEQMQAIQKELGEKDEGRAEINEIEDMLKKKKLSDEARTKVTKELKKLKMMSAMSAEAAVIRNYVETVLSLPWNDLATEVSDIRFASKVLDEDHYGLEKVKERILEYLSVRMMSKDMKAPILCLVGPPGVGKTSLAQSVARATGRPFVKISLGGVRDESEIRGHRRTYIGAMPGKIITAMKKAGKNNPVVLLDEIEKMNSDFRGDPSSAMLEVLDPAQNQSFSDHYLDLDYDLSKVLFLATANAAHLIPGPLRDRMEMISLRGYTDFEKINIAERYLIPRQLKENALEKQDVRFQPSSLEELLHYYTREAGVRNLEREIATICRKLVKKSLDEISKKNEKAGKKNSKMLIPDHFLKEKVTGKSVQKYLGQRRYRFATSGSQNEIGICTGLAWTEVGGELLVAEVNVTKGKGKMLITGKLGEVMQESAQAAMSYVRSRATFLGIDEDFYHQNDIHIHIPEGAIPKDGPSAGICMATALTSALTGRPVSKSVAMTGEITLRGRVLPIGGLKEKILAAHRGGISKVIIPKENEKDLDDLPKSVLKDITVVAVEHMDNVLVHALVWKKEPNETNQKDEVPTDTLLQKLVEGAEIDKADLFFAH